MLRFDHWNKDSCQRSAEFKRNYADMNDPAMLEITAVEIANYLAKTGHVIEGATILRDLIVNHPRAVSVKGVTALARIAYDGKNWADAATLWRLATKADSNNLEALLKLAHCLIEMDQRAEAENFAFRIRTLLNNPSGNSDATINDPLLTGFYEQICIHYLGNAMSKVEDLLRLAAMPESYAAKVLSPGQVAGALPGLSDDAIANRLDQALHAWEESDRTVPYTRAMQSRNPSSPNSGTTKGKRVLLVFRKYFLGSANSREHELAFFFQASARAVGFEMDFFPAEPFLNPSAVQPKQQYAELDKLANLVISTKPDLIVFDDLCNREATGGYLGREVYCNLLCALRSLHPFKLIAFYPDSWTPASLATIDYVRSFVDVVWHQNLDLVKSEKDPSKSKMFCAPIPYPENYFAVGKQGKDLGATFVGGLFDYNCPRGIWLALIRSRGIPCQIYLSNHTQTGSPAGATVAEYASFMSRIKMSVNFSARTAAKKIMTGRAWESIIARSLLLEEDNEEIKRYFVPFVHYVPFANIDELQAYVSFFERNAPARNAVAERGYDWFRQIFSKERIWSDLVSVAFE